MACVPSLSLWCCALLALVLVREIEATNVHVRVHHRHHNQKHSTQTRSSPTATADTEDDETAAAAQRVACPMDQSPLVGAVTPALTTACPSSCSSNNLCIFYPQNFTAQCATTTRRTCYRGESDACAFQCIPNADRLDGWYLSLYDDAAVLDEVNAWNRVNDDRRSVAIDISVARQWLGRITLPTGMDTLYVTGNEAANDISFDDEAIYYQDSVARPKGAIVPFELPLTLYEDVQRLEYLRFENIKAPVVPANQSKKMVFPVLAELYLRNTMLTSFPLAGASLPALTALDLSMNSLTEITQSAIPATLQFLNLSFNAISHPTKGSFPENLTSLDLAGNSISKIQKGTLPLWLEQLYVDGNALTEIPSDIAGMEDLVILWMNDNMLKEIPQKALPLTVDTLSLNNCSLTTVPRVVKEMTALGSLSLSSNDLGHNVDFSVLPETLVTLLVDYCNLSKFPVALQKLPDLTTLSIAGNPKAVADLKGLSETLTTLYLDDNDLEAVPKGVKDLNLDYLGLEYNPLGQLAPGSLPQALSSVSMVEATFTEIKAGTLPASLTDISIVDSALQVAPEDIRTMRNLYNLVITNCSLETFDAASALPELTTLDLRNNRITRFTGRYAAMTYLDLRHNALYEFNVSSAPLLETLHLGENQLTAFPTSIFGMNELLLLNLSGNLIRNFTPSVDQLTALARIPNIVLDQDMFTTNCDAVDRMALREYSVCSPNANGNATNLQQQKASSSKMSVGLVLLNVCLAVALALLVVTFWRRRSLQKKRLQDLDVKTASLNKMQRHQTSASIWSDTVLLQNRLDEDLVERKRLLGSGMYGEVWLAIYKQEKFALKQLKQSGDTPIERQQINDFVEEIKLLSSLSHASVVKFVGVVWTKESDIAMVTEYMDGGDLRSFLDENLKVDNGWTVQMVRVALNITEALVYLHSLEAAVIHRDLKSRNVLLDKAMRAKLSDFGISRYKLDDETMTAAVGTVRWVAPEVLAGHRYDESVDMYSLGIILSEIDTHKLPFDDLTDETGHERLTDSAIAGLLLSGSLTSSFSDSCPSEIRSLAERCTSFDPTDRPTGLQVAYELRMMLKNASAWTHSSSGTFLSASSVDDELLATATSVDTARIDVEEEASVDALSSTHVSL